MPRHDRKCPWAAILITEISVSDNRLGIFRQWPYYPPACGESLFFFFFSIEQFYSILLDFFLLQFLGIYSLIVVIIIIICMNICLSIFVIECFIMPNRIFFI